MDETQKRIDKAIADKNKRIQEYRSETQLSIQLGQALNLAVEVLLHFNNDPMSVPEGVLDAQVNFFMSYLDKKRKEIFDENERAFKENPAPTPDQYEQMSSIQKAFLKDKQLQNNRKLYHERKENAKQSSELSIADEVSDN